jgi:hypothetical protein
MGLMRDAAEWCLLLWWPMGARPCHILDWLAESLALMSKSGPKVMAFGVMKGYQLPPDPWISSIWV